MVKELILMNRKVPVVSVEYSHAAHAFTRVNEVISPGHLPLLGIDPRLGATKHLLNVWWQSRAIPESRCGLERLKQILGIDSPLSLAEENAGLSLSDQYWLSDPDNPQDWDDVNYFNNDFSDNLGSVTLGQRCTSYDEGAQLDIDRHNPSAVLNGNLQKKWTIQGGKRILLKSGSGWFRQEVENEVVATSLHRRLLPEGEFVPYSVCRQGGVAYSSCPNMLTDTQELVSAFDIICNHKQRNSESDYQFLIRRCKDLGVKGAVASLCKMFACDYLIANSDRHYRNFGLIRDVVTADIVGVAPIYDSGMALWCDADRLEVPIDFEYKAKPFNIRGMRPETQLTLFDDYSWFDASALKGWPEEAVSILSGNPLIPKERLKTIRKKLVERCRHLELVALRSMKRP